MEVEVEKLCLTLRSRKGFLKKVKKDFDSVSSSYKKMGVYNKNVRSFVDFKY